MILPGMLCWQLWALSVHVRVIRVCDTVRTFAGLAMRAAIFQVDAFTRRRFAGNPAAVMLLDEYPAEALMQAVAAENNLAETAFIVAHGDDYRIRWFTPSVEVPLCGHATLASAAVVLEPDLAAIARLDRSGVIVTAAGSGDYDFVSRYFAPAKGIPEDPVTGGAHCMLVPYWAEQLKRSAFRAYQASPRGGEIVCRLKGERVELEGACVFYMEGTAEI